MIKSDSRGALPRKMLKNFLLFFALVLCTAAAPGHAENVAVAPVDPIAATLNKAAVDKTVSAPATKPTDNNAQPAPTTTQDASTAAVPDNGNLPPMPTDKESLKTLTNALAADKSAIDEKDRQRKAFENALNNTFPLSPEQIKQVMQRMSESQEAGRSPPAPEPKATVKVENISLDPGVTPPLIAVSSGYVTTVNLLDVTGQPWPVQDVVIGGNFQVTGPNDANVLRIIPQTRFGKGNLSVRLVGLSTPVTFRVESGGPEVYYRYDARIPQSGPGARQSLIDHGYTGEAGNTNLLAVLDGMPPDSAKKMILTGPDGRTRAYKIDDQIYLRTPLTLLSPGWDASVRSADGTNVYMINDTPIIMLSDNGQMIRTKITPLPEDAFRPSDLQNGKVTVPVNTDGSVAAAGGTKPPEPPVAPTPPPVVAPVAQAAANPTPARPSNGVQIYSNGYSQNYPPTGNSTNINIGNTGGKP